MCLGALLEADLGSPFNLGIVNPKRYLAIPLLAVQIVPLSFPQIVVTLAGL